MILLLLSNLNTVPGEPDPDPGPGTELTVYHPGSAGMVPEFVSVHDGGDLFPLVSRAQVFRFKNAGGSDRTVTFIAQRVCQLGYLHNAAVIVPAGAELTVDDIDPAIYANADQRVHLTYDSISGLSVESFT